MSLRRGCAASCDVFVHGHKPEQKPSPRSIRHRALTWVCIARVLERPLSLLPFAPRHPSAADFTPPAAASPAMSLLADFDPLTSPSNNGAAPASSPVAVSGAASATRAQKTQKPFQGVTSVWTGEERSEGAWHVLHSYGAASAHLAVSSFLFVKC